MDGSSAFAAVVLAVGVPKYKFPVEKGGIDAFSLLTNIAVEISFYVVLTKFLSHFFVLTEFRKSVVEWTHRVFVLVSIILIMVAYVLLSREETGGSLLSEATSVRVNIYLLLFLLAGIILVKIFWLQLESEEIVLAPFKWIWWVIRKVITGMWKVITWTWAFILVHYFSAAFSVTAISGAAYLFKLDPEYHKKTCLCLLAAAFIHPLSDLVLPLFSQPEGAGVTEDEN